MARDATMTADRSFVGTLQRSWGSLWEQASRFDFPAPLLIASVVLLFGIIFYVSSVSSFQETRSEINLVEKELKVLAADHTDLTARLESWRSPGRLTELAEKYRMVAPTPHTVWRMK